MKKIIFVLIAMLVFCSCRKEAQSTYATSNVEIRVDYLFEVDEIKVYRFFDGGHAVYFTSRKGETTSEYTTSNGKAYQTHYVRCYND